MFWAQTENSDLAMKMMWSSQDQIERHKYNHDIEADFEFGFTQTFAMQGVSHFCSYHFTCISILKFLLFGCLMLV